MPKVLTRLRIDEVSAVDRGAGDGVKVILMKRGLPLSKGPVERAERELRKAAAERKAFDKFNDMYIAARDFGASHD